MHHTCLCYVSWSDHLSLDFVAAYITHATIKWPHTQLLRQPDLLLVWAKELRANKNVLRTNLHIWPIQTVQITPTTHVCDSFHSFNRLNNPPCPVLMTHTPTALWPGAHQDALPFTLQKICGQLHPINKNKGNMIQSSSWLIF